MTGCFFPYFSSPAGRLILFGFWMILWWAFEVVPIPVTALIPVAFFPLLGVIDERELVISYSRPIIFLFMGGFFLAKALEAVNLHKKFAIEVLLLLLGGSYERIIMAFMFISFFLSMWISNTATTLLMLAVSLGVFQFLKEQGQKGENFNHFQKALLLSIAYSSSIGGAASLIGTPPNALLASYLRENHDVHLSMLSWMKMALPFTLCLLLSVWFFLSKVFFKISQETIHLESYLLSQKKILGSSGRDERVVLFVLLTTVFSWIFRDFLSKSSGLVFSDAGIALIASLVLFSFPSDSHKGSILSWKKAEGIPWGVLIMFGGALSLTKGFNSTGLLGELGFFIKTLPELSSYVLLGGLAVTALFGTEFLTNSAAIAALLPIFTLLSERYGLSISSLSIPSTLSCSLAFMFPIATPPNAIIFSSGKVPLKDMLLCGFVLNMLSLFFLFFFYGLIGLA